MTYKARQVLEDCELALEFLEQSTNDQIWRIHWFAAVALVRTVGDVLDKVDGRNPIYTKSIKSAYQIWKADQDSNKIFWCFIKEQRDKLIHEYDSDAHPSHSASIVLEFDLVSLADGTKTRHGTAIELEENIYRPMLAGPWEGDDARDVLREAIDWWSIELDKIDLEAHNKR